MAKEVMAAGLSEVATLARRATGPTEATEAVEVAVAVAAVKVGMQRKASKTHCRCTPWPWRTEAPQGSPLLVVSIYFTFQSEAPAVAKSKMSIWGESRTSTFVV